MLSKYINYLHWWWGGERNEFVFISCGADMAWHARIHTPIWLNIMTTDRWHEEHWLSPRQHMKKLVLKMGGKGMWWRPNYDGWKIGSEPFQNCSCCGLFPVCNGHIAPKWSKEGAVRSQKQGHGGPTAAQTVKEINAGSDRTVSGHTQMWRAACGTQKSVEVGMWSSERRWPGLESFYTTRMIGCWYTR